jgi:hypothetical protein
MKYARYFTCPALRRAQPDPKQGVVDDHCREGASDPASVSLMACRD